MQTSQQQKKRSRMCTDLTQKSMHASSAITALFATGTKASATSSTTARCSSTTILFSTQYQKQTQHANAARQKKFLRRLHRNRKIQQHRTELPHTMNSSC